MLKRHPGATYGTPSTSTDTNTHTHSFIQHANIQPASTCNLCKITKFSSNSDNSQCNKCIEFVIFMEWNWFHLGLGDWCVGATKLCWCVCVCVYRLHSAYVFSKYYLRILRFKSVVDFVGCCVWCIPLPPQFLPHGWITRCRGRLFTVILHWTLCIGHITNVNINCFQDIGVFYVVSRSLIK